MSGVRWSDVEINFIKNCLDSNMCVYETYVAHSKKFKVDRSEKAIKTMSIRRNLLKPNPTREPLEKRSLAKDKTLSELKFKSSRLLYAKQVFSEKFSSKYLHTENLKEILNSRKRDHTEVRKAIYKEMVDMGFKSTEIAKAAGKDHTSILAAVNGKKR